MAEELHGLAWLAKKVMEDRARKSLTETDIAIIRGMANHNLKMSEVATELYMHRNTVAYHCDTIKKKTGDDPRDFFGCCKLLVLIQDLEDKSGKT